MLQLPRSARLAAWGSAVLRGEVAVGQAVAAVTGDDEPHRVDGLDASPDLAGGLDADPGAGLPALLGALAGFGVRGLRLALPVPGDVLGLCGPPGFDQLAVEASECVLGHADPRSPGWGLVPVVQAFGSVWEPGRLVAWSVHRTGPQRGSDAATLAEADRALRECLAEATSTLSALDVARWRDDDAARIAAVRSGELGPRAVPPRTAARAVRVLATAARVRGIVELAGADDGAAITGWEAARRAEALRELDGVARRGIVAAVNSLLEPAG